MLREHFHLRFALFYTYSLAHSIVNRFTASSNRGTSSPLATIVAHFLLQLVLDVVLLEKTLNGFEVI